MRMPFGCHKGKPVADLPPDYLQWLSTIAKPPLSVEVQRALELVRCSEPVPAVDEGRVHNVFRRLARKWHPDNGGDNRAMAAINDFYQGLTTATT
jgi:hypothetical protein